MTLTRRDFIRATTAAPAFAALAGFVAAAPSRGEAMYGLIGKMNATPGQRAALVEILLEGVRDMPGCLSYVVALDPSDDDAIWITEVWDSRASHEASLALPSVRHAVAQARPLIAGFGERIETQPVGGHGLPAPSRRGA
jgi:quinol monooxygenase YgiN